MKQKWTRNSWLWLVVVLGLFFIASYFFQPYQQKDYPAYLTTSPSPTGVKAFYTYLERELATVKRWNRSPSKLSDQANNEVLVMIEPSVMATEDQIDAYVDFMWHGNTIMLFQRNPDELFGLTTESILYNGEKTIYDKNGDTYEAEVSYRYRLVPNIDDEILIYDNSGPIALKRSFGKGELIVSLFPELGNK
ncbi:DUF4350 domain-containing protein [Paracerasibacillus soli]|uniref:DUF4350 domain-containing protein n=1 Tax=Paracerasibacillus soli TaxID=480284 RepID=A0ABU5CTZ0_9BACI|nr:DUF4350 domain-containing protein [Virgibacillus soli]MDY0408893.1 DUF4350 domain-containing protein [Virgibacillus soli]